MDFPHLSDTTFPMLDNVNVYSYRNTFDYTRWGENTRVTLTNVLWDSEYNDVVKFDSNDARDEWFDNKQEVFQVKLTTRNSIPPEGGIKLPIPFDVATRFNYLFVDVPVMTSEDNPIEYEVDGGVRRWYFFVDDVSSRAPNTTMFHLSLDVWTQFQNDLTIKYLYLERGHAPVAASDTDTYLANPISNNDYLLAPDVTPSGSSVVRSSNLVPYGNGAKYVCIASTCAPSQLPSLGSVAHNVADYTFGSISYSDVDARYGYQLQVNGYGIGNGDDYSNLRAPAQPIDKTGRIANNVCCYAIAATEVYGSGRFLDDVLSTCPQFMNTIQGCFVVSAEMVTLGSAVTIAGHTLHVAVGAQDAVPIPTLEREDFGYPERYQRFAKLYTFPYATIELTDNEGQVREVRIENTSNMTAQRICEIAFPYVSTRMYFTGINGEGSISYTWRNLDGTTTNAGMANSDWFDFCFDHEIPCYALYIDPETAWYLDNFNSRLRDGRLSHLAAYHNAVRNANTARANAVDSNNTAYTNTDADATTLTTNTANTTAMQAANAGATAATNTSKTGRANHTSSLITSKNNAKASALTGYANSASSKITDIENESTSAVTRNNNSAMTGGAVASAAVGGSMLAYATAGAGIGSVVPGMGTLAGLAAGAAVGGVTGLIQANINASAANDNATTVIQANEETYDANRTQNSNSTGTSNLNNTSVTGDMNDQRTGDTSDDNALLIGNTARSNENMTSNNGNTAATMRNNMNRTRDTGNANAGHTRDVGVMNSKETLESTRNGIQYAMYDARNSAPRPVGAYAGDPTADYMRTRGVQVKVKTMPDSDVRQVGDWFARYGYALNQIWDVESSGLCPMRHFCYWKASDAWVDDRQSSNSMATALVTSMLTRGVTVWNNPDEVGRVNVYDN